MSVTLKHPPLEPQLADFENPRSKRGVLEGGHGPGSDPRSKRGVEIQYGGRGPVPPGVSHPPTVRARRPPCTPRAPH